MTLEDLADLIRANSANTSRRMEELHNETYGKLLSMEDMTEVKVDVSDLKRSLDLAETLRL